MALERDPSTTKNAFLLLKGAGRGVISEHGAQMAIELLENNGFQIWEIKPDPPVEPTPAPPPIPRFGSYESILLHEQDFRNKLRDLEETGRELVKEFDEARYDMQPVLQAIALAMENKEVPQNGGEEG